MDALCIREVTSKDELEAYFTQDNIFLHLYEIGDLDDFFWPHTKWITLQNQTGDILFTALIYSASSLPVILALGGNIDDGKILLEKMKLQGLLPGSFYSHLSVGLPDALQGAGTADYHGRYLKMGLFDKTVVGSVSRAGTVQLLPAHLASIHEFYAESYPGNWFDARMLDSLQTFGIWDENAAVADDSTATAPSGSRKLIAVAGIHVFSPLYKVASLGNIAVHPAHRGKGLATKVTAALVSSLLQEGIEHIGLNVSEVNQAAIACYTKLGFSEVGKYEEIMWEAVEK